MRALLLAFCLLFGFAAGALAEEKITSFISDVTVNADASLEVRERISVNAEGDEIRRGILRDFPTIYTDRNGVRVKVGFEVIEVLRNGRSEPFGLESLSNGTRIRIGNKDVLIGSGIHVYEITYRTTRQLGFFEDYDELYWNVTGNGWTFPIDRAAVDDQAAARRQHPAVRRLYRAAGRRWQGLPRSQRQWNHLRGGDHAAPRAL